MNIRNRDQVVAKSFVVFSVGSDFNEQIHFLHFLLPFFALPLNEHRVGKMSLSLLKIGFGKNASEMIMSELGSFMP